MSFEHDPHPHVEARAKAGAPTVAHAAAAVLPQRVNRWLAVQITRGVGTMWCAWAFLALSLVALPAAITSHNAVVIVSWVSQTCLQLVFLPIITVGQAVLAEAADRRAQAAYDDGTAILAETRALQAHLTAQDEVLHSLAEGSKS